MRDIFDEAYEVFMYVVCGITDAVLRGLVYLTLPLWVIPYVIIRRLDND